MTALTRLLDEGAKFDPHYVPSMNADHMPMTLTSMSDLGANDAQLEEYHERYRQRLRPVQGGPTLTSIAEGQGRFDAFEELRRLLQIEIDADGFETVISRYLPDLLSSLAAGAFHPLIRLGFAIHSQHKMEVASALAYWMTQRFNPKLLGHSGTDLSAALTNLDAVEITSGRFGAGLNQLVELDVYPAPVDTTLEDCARTSLDVYLGTRNFFALHFVTGTQAARVCAPYVSMSDLIAALTAAIQAGYLVVGAPDFSKPLPPPAQLDEEHNIKYMFACASEYREYGDPRYLDEMHGFVETGLVPNWIKIPG